MSGLPDYTKGVRVVAGSIPSQHIGSLSIIVKTYGTLTASRSPGGTLAGARNAGSITRGTLSTSRYAGGTLAGARNAGSLVRGTLNNLRLPRSISIGTITAWANAGSLNRGSVPTNRYLNTGTLAGARNAGSLVRGTIGAARLQLLQNIPGTLQLDSVKKVAGTLGINRGQSQLGTVLKQQHFEVSIDASMGNNQTARLFRMTVPSGKALKLWSMGVSISTGTSTGGKGSLFTGLYSESQGTWYSKGTKTYQAGNPIASSPAGTSASFKVYNITGLTQNVAAFGDMTLE